MQRRRALVAVLAFLVATVWTAGPTRADAAAPVPLATETLVANAGGNVWSIAFAPDGAAFYSIRATGKLYRYVPGGTPQLLVTLPSCVCGEGGLLGLATSPTFAVDGYLYAMYTYGGAATATGFANRVVRLSVGPTAATVDGTVQDGILGGTTHDGGRLAFGPDGFLYATIGDGRNSPNPAQDTSVLGGKILRLAPTGGAAPGNPFANPVWSFGHRNPQGIDWLPDGSMYSSEQGPTCRDELNRIVGGSNYGWTGDEGCPPVFPPGSVAPVQLYTETTTLAMSGLAFYGSPAIPQWTGSLFFTTLKDTTLYRVRLGAGGGSVVEEEQLYRGTYGRLRSVEAAPDGSLWLSSEGGAIVRVRSLAPPPAPPIVPELPMPALSVAAATGVGAVVVRRRVRRAVRSDVSADSM